MREIKIIGSRSAEFGDQLNVELESCEGAAERVENNSYLFCLGNMRVKCCFSLIQRRIE